MKLSNPTKAPTPPARAWKPARLNRAAYQRLNGGSMEFTALLENGMHVHVTLTDAELDSLVEHRRYAKEKLTPGEPGADERTWYGTTF